MKALIGVMPESAIRSRVLAIACGELTPEPDEPKIWFTSVHAIGQILSNENIALLRLIDARQPQTLSELATLAGRQKSNLSVTLKSLSNYGFVALEKSGRTLKPVAIYTDFEIHVDQQLMQKYSGIAG